MQGLVALEHEDAAGVLARGQHRGQLAPTAGQGRTQAVGVDGAAPGVPVGQTEDQLAVDLGEPGQPEAFEQASAL